MLGVCQHCFRMTAHHCLPAWAHATRCNFAPTCSPFSLMYDQKNDVSSGLLISGRPIQSAISGDTLSQVTHAHQADGQIRIIQTLTGVYTGQRHPLQLLCEAIGRASCVLAARLALSFPGGFRGALASFANLPLSRRSSCVSECSARCMCLRLPEDCCAYQSGASRDERTLGLEDVLRQLLVHAEHVDWWREDRP